MRSRPAVRSVCLGLAALLALAQGCEQSQNRGQKSGADLKAPPAAPFAGRPMGMKDAEGPLDDNAVALKVSGINSAEELNRDAALLDDPSLRQVFESAFRYCFSAKLAQRQYGESIGLAQKIIGARPDFAPAYRVLGYAYFNSQEPSEALNAYLKAVDLDPNYGEAHYALAFMFAMGDVAKGREHYKKAMALGIKDERDLGNRFYHDAQ